MIEVGRLWRCIVLLEVTSISSVLLSKIKTKIKHVRSCPHLTSLIHDCIERSSSDIPSGGADICNCKSSANEWCMIVQVNNGRQRLNIHDEKHRAKNLTLRSTSVQEQKQNND